MMPAKTKRQGWKKKNKSKVVVAKDFPPNFLKKVVDVFIENKTKQYQGEK